MFYSTIIQGCSSALLQSFIAKSGRGGKFSQPIKSLLFCSFLAICIPLNAVPVNRGQDSIPNLRRPDSALHFIVMGDWGRHGSAGQRKVAAVMAEAAAQLKISFVITTGDNFYDNGVSTEFDPQWDSSFEQVYDAGSLQVTWYPVLGNHDYNLNPDAQIAYTRVSNRWTMPGRYYDTAYALNSDSVLFVFIDTDPIEREFRKQPYDSKFKAGSVTDQLNWLKKALSSSQARWKIVVGHHPLHTGGGRRHISRTRKMRAILQPLFHQYGVNLYLSGHEHHLEYLKPKGPTHYIISGSASDVGHVGWLKKYRRFGARKKGFVTLSLNKEKLLIQFIGDKGKLLYSRDIIQR